ncbi:XAP5, circadian clock regulator-domain-containing protein [Microdochium trichocladiopsis]|uniref:XAP5, circadian clock regulator-domain-containing protein n=1 Tax=Microdochium trichocladiopsis TaxID=1682393 RepID=A0A9P8YEZ9_9PEZI|nr:XAP5, circadian clock regulator-domain-containing protein [Microdochium trichocladiopsis]KAH7035778.1 XAP5, circadian clock regulator-domain-containing protein [Microdochium trichocladiopsis]
MPAADDSSGESRFAAAAPTPQQVLSNNTVGLVALSDFRKRRAELLDQQDRDAASSDGPQTPNATSTPPSRSQTGTPVLIPDGDGMTSGGTDAAPGPPRKKKKALKKSGPAKLSFDDDDADNDAATPRTKTRKKAGRDDVTPQSTTYKLKANSAVSVVPRSMTKSALRREAAERETLRREFLARQEALKAAEIAIPFVFYDGANLPGGIVRVKKGDFIWIFLDKSRKVGAQLGVGEKTNATKVWARVGVDDLIMVRGGVIIPHHYDFLYFIMNKTLGPNDTVLFAYSNEPPSLHSADTDSVLSQHDASYQPLSTAVTKAASLVDVRALEGASDDPSWTKVVDRRWYERNKHIYPASTWREFDPEKDYRQEIRRDLGGNTFFYS